jgi:hypothetical protein
MSLNDDTDHAAKVLENYASRYGHHSGPQSTEDERFSFSRDLRTAALRYARAYYAEARALGLIEAPKADVLLDSRAKQLVEKARDIKATCESREFDPLCDFLVDAANLMRDMAKAGKET